MIGFTAAGLIAAQLPIEWAFYLDGLSFLISAVCVALSQRGLRGLQLRRTLDLASFQLGHAPAQRFYLDRKLGVACGLILHNVLLGSSYYYRTNDRASR